MEERKKYWKCLLDSSRHSRKKNKTIDRMLVQSPAAMKLSSSSSSSLLPLSARPHHRLRHHRVSAAAPVSESFLKQHERKREKKEPIFWCLHFFSILALSLSLFLQPRPLLPHLSSLLRETKKTQTRYAHSAAAAKEEEVEEEETRPPPRSSLRRRSGVAAATRRSGGRRRRRGSSGLRLPPLPLPLRPPGPPPVSLLRL